MSRFEIQSTKLEGLAVVQRSTIGDERGFLSRVFCANELKTVGWDWPVVQVNHTCTPQKGAVRGMHFQLPPKAEAKLVSCLRGTIWDVAVDLRQDSPTFLGWHAEELSADNRKAALIPPGFAHGFQVLSEGCELLYMHSEFFAAEAERGIHPLDPIVGINWPLQITKLSRRDDSHPPLTPAFTGLAL